MWAGGQEHDGVTRGRQSRGLRKGVGADRKQHGWGMGGVQGEGGGSGGGGVAWRDGGHRAKSEGALGRRWRSREWRVRGWPAPGEVQHAENVRWCLHPGT